MTFNSYPTANLGLLESQGGNALPMTHDSKGVVRGTLNDEPDSITEMQLNDIRRKYFKPINPNNNSGCNNIIIISIMITVAP